MSDAFFKSDLVPYSFCNARGFFDRLANDEETYKHGRNLNFDSTDGEIEEEAHYRNLHIAKCLLETHVEFLENRSKAEEKPRVRDAVEDLAKKVVNELVREKSEAVVAAAYRRIDDVEFYRRLLAAFINHIACEEFFIKYRVFFNRFNMMSDWIAHEDSLQTVASGIDSHEGIYKELSDLVSETVEFWNRPDFYMSRCAERIENLDLMAEKLGEVVNVYIAQWNIRRRRDGETASQRFVSWFSEMQKRVNNDVKVINEYVRKLQPEERTKMRREMKKVQNGIKEIRNGMREAKRLFNSARNAAKANKTLEEFDARQQTRSDDDDDPVWDGIKIARCRSSGSDPFPNDDPYIKVKRRVDVSYAIFLVSNDLDMKEFECRVLHYYAASRGSAPDPFEDMHVLKDDLTLWSEESDSDVEAEAEAETKVEAEAKEEAEAEAKVNAKAEAEAKVEAKAEAEAKVEAKEEAEAKKEDEGFEKFFHPGHFLESLGRMDGVDGENKDKDDERMTIDRRRKLVQRKRRWIEVDD